MLLIYFHDGETAKVSNAAFQTGRAIEPLIPFLHYDRLLSAFFVSRRVALGEVARLECC